MLHPVGPLPAVVYWRRRLLVLGCAVGLLGGGGWVTAAAMGSDPEESTATAATGPAPAPPVLDQVVPSLAAVELPTTTPAPTGVPEPVAPGPVEGGPCTDDMISVEVRSDPASAPVGSKPTFHLVVTNVAPVSCVRTLDKGLQEVVLLDGAGTRLWGSNDCFPEAGSDVRTLAPGEAADFSVLWSGLGSEPGCAGDRAALPPGQYVLRARLDTKTSPDAALTLT
ncbi:MucR family transcriptional regulator [Modestobacter marinus]|uniref:MucR family transcriptional regulator n=1 Tax=Modestobacter marinus TaxID=477641 RepID=UPI001C962FB6|nr:MucR family transcriptional regulator [Modestobacter marinus]